LETIFKKFDRNNFDPHKGATYLGSGSPGGKAAGLGNFIQILESTDFAPQFDSIEVSVPRFTVIRTDIFDLFMQENDLYDIALSNESDDRIALAFQEAHLPFEVLGDLHELISKIHYPLAVRSSSLLEDAQYEPFAGIYETKMTPNNQADTESRFKRLIESIKFIYASTYFRTAKEYMAAINQDPGNEKMAVVIQNIVGQRYSDRFYPDISGVARSYNFYSLGKSKAEDGIVNLALGLGKTIVDGENSWSYSPKHPKIGPPFGSISEILKQTQNKFWCVNMGSTHPYDPLTETEYLLSEDLSVAETDKRLKYLVSTYDPQGDRITPGMGVDGPRVLTFAPLLSFNDIPVNDIIKYLLQISERSLQVPCEIEFAICLSDKKANNTKHKFGFLQVRPMVVPNAEVEIYYDELKGKQVLIASESTLGNGEISTIQDIVYVRPDKFDAAYTKKIADEIGTINKKLLDLNRNYILIGFGRWGSSDPWLGIPATWGQISGARVIVESMLENMNVELSQGSHFFHNLTSFQIPYFSVPFSGDYQIDWTWFENKGASLEGEFVNWIHLEKPLIIRVDGRSGYGIILKS
jgi:hypothetical protein